MSDIIRMESVEYGSTKNHLHFKGYIPRKDSNLLYDFDFTGVEVIVNTYLPEKATEQLKENLINNFGYAPYDIEKVKQIFENSRDYVVDTVAGN